MWTNIKKFQQDLEKGGYVAPAAPDTLLEAFSEANSGWSEFEEVNFYRVLLDPKAWETIGKIRGWTPESWKQRFWKMAFAISDGVSIEDYLGTI